MKLHHENFQQLNGNKKRQSNPNKAPHSLSAHESLDSAYYTRFQFAATLNKLTLNILVEVLYQGLPVYSNVNTMEEIHTQYM